MRPWATNRAACCAGASGAATNWLSRLRRTGGTEPPPKDSDARLDVGTGVCVEDDCLRSSSESSLSLVRCLPRLLRPLARAALRGAAAGLRRWRGVCDAAAGVRCWPAALRVRRWAERTTCHASSASGEGSCCSPLAGASTGVDASLWISPSSKLTPAAATDAGGGSAAFAAAAAATRCRSSCCDT